MKTSVSKYIPWYVLAIFYASLDFHIYIGNLKLRDLIQLTSFELPFTCNVNSFFRMLNKFFCKAKAITPYY